MSSSTTSTIEIGPEKYLENKNKYKLKDSVEYRILPILSCCQCTFLRKKTPSYSYCSLRSHLRKLPPKELYLEMPKECPLKKAKSEHLPDKINENERESNGR